MSILDKIASDCISYHTNIASGTSFVAGLPGGLAMIGTIPADVAQFYFHVFVIAQKLSYVYGYPDLCDKTATSQKTLPTCSRSLWAS